MARPPKGDEPLTDTLRMRIPKSLADRLDSQAIRLSKPGDMKSRSDVAREAIEEGLEVIEKRKK